MTDQDSLEYERELYQCLATLLEHVVPGGAADVIIFYIGLVLLCQVHSIPRADPFLNERPGYQDRDGVQRVYRVETKQALDRVSLISTEFMRWVGGTFHVVGGLPTPQQAVELVNQLDM